MIPTTPMMNPTGMLRNINQGAAAAAQLPSFAGCGQPMDPKIPIRIGEIAIARATNPTMQPGFVLFFWGGLIGGTSGGILIVLPINLSKAVYFPFAD